MQPSVPSALPTGTRVYRSFPPDPDGWFVEPPWIARRLFEEEPFDGPVVDPACGLGTIPEAAAAAGLPAFGFDRHPRWTYPDIPAERRPSTRVRYGVADFLDGDAPRWARGGFRPGAIVSNVPTRRAEPELVPRFFERAIRLAPKVAFLVQTPSLSAIQGGWIENSRPRRVLIVSPRPTVPPGATVLAGGKQWGGEAEYVWLIWERGWSGATELGWLRRESRSADPC